MVSKVARLMAPIALLAVALGIYLIVHPYLARQSASAAQTSTTTSLVNGHRHPVHHAKHVKKFYVVKSGDTLSGISSKTGVGVYTLIQLNPRLAKSQNSLQIGERLRLRR